MIPFAGLVNVGLIPSNSQSTFTGGGWPGSDWTGLNSGIWDDFTGSMHQSSFSLVNQVSSFTSSPNSTTVQIQTDGTGTVTINGMTYTGNVTLTGPDLNNLSNVAGSGSVFDAAQYLASYPDLIVAFGYDLDAATRHYFTSGITEGRSMDTFDEVRYLSSNPDLIAAFGNDLAAATRHYIQYGYAEGRMV